MRNPENLSRDPSNKHYSEKGGHKLRGHAARQRSKFESRFPRTPYLHSRAETDFSRRRFMMRDPSSGKKREG